MPTLSAENFLLLQRLGIVCEAGNVTSEAYAGAVGRENVFGQARLLDLPLICLRPQKGQTPEQRVESFCSAQVKGHIDCGEGYFIKKLINFLVPFFDHRKRRVLYERSDLYSALERISQYEESDIVGCAEQGDSFETYGDHFRRHFEPMPLSETRVSKDFLKQRFYSSKIRKPEFIITNEEWNAAKQDAYSNYRQSQFIRSVWDYLTLWRALPKETWLALIERVISDWKKLYIGWPDVTIASETGNLTLVEVKGKDKVHVSQVYTLLELKRLLGRERVCLGWVSRNTITIEQRFYSEHLKQAKLFIANDAIQRVDPPIPEWISS